MEFLNELRTQELINETKSRLAGKQDTLTFDNAPTENSNNPVKSGGVYAVNEALTNQVKGHWSEGGKNLLPFNLADIIVNNTIGTWSGNTYTRNGVEFTVNDDGTVTANGTATDVAGFEFFGGPNNFKTNDFKGCILTGGLSSDARIAAQGADSATGGNTENYNDLGNGVTIGSKDYIRFYLRVASGATVSDVVFKPMIRLASDTNDTYESYAKTNQQLTEDTTGLLDNLEVNGAVNMLPNNGTSQTINEVTFTVNPDKSITAVVASTPSSARYFDIYNFDASYPHIGETLKLSGCPKNGGSNTYALLVNNASVGIGASDYGDGKIFLFDNDGTTTPAKARIKIGTSCPAGTYVFKPMITVPSYNGDYVPYAKSNKELTKDVSDIAYESLTDYGSSEYTLTEGKMWQTKGVTFLYVAVTCTTVSPIENGYHIQIATIPSKFKKPQFNMYPTICNYRDGSSHIGAQLQVQLNGTIAIRGGEAGARYCGLFSY